MNSLFDIWKNKIPRYDQKFKKPLFEKLTQYGGGAEETRYSKGKQFSNNYELYLYAFFLGLYFGEPLPIPKENKKTDFSHHLQYWGSKGNRIDRKDFTYIQDYVFMALIARTDVDFIALDKDELSADEVASDLIETMESYTNYGLTMILENIEENPNYFQKQTAFLDLMLNGK